MIIIITGTPGSGKSTIVDLLSKKLGFEKLHVSSFLIQNKAFSEYDELRQSYVIDEEKAFQLIDSFIKNRNVVIETIYPSLISHADKVIVLRKDPRVLYVELKRRGWGELKIAENVMAEILGVISGEAKEYFGNICEINVTNKKPEEVVEQILSNNCDIVDWLNIEEIQDLLISLDKVISSYEDSISDE
ncbi:adenylate kinase family protein [Sulfurisphaera ohwakuensis]|uniref:Putative adenylate kinase n=1 Tax=Sulfurisphaera ohwakuensis TaxID=69656 RepID=A0A650CDF7_SULOH|nr:adenylate kinase family protein [Sulfurisphaera ohwakuensis]MBB5253290.1 adenylate kinase [Sulfurisphaera ohwakuensis]QGR15809.1 AAA family ATPase [Sulfurisphaera ohwakuensis]